MALNPPPPAPIRTVDAATVAEIKQNSQDVEDEDLRAALEAFGTAIHTYSDDRKK